MPPFYSHSKLRLLKDNFDFSKKKEQNSPSVICLPANRLNVFLSLKLRYQFRLRRCCGTGVFEYHLRRQCFTFSKRTDHKKNETV